MSKVKLLFENHIQSLRERAKEIDESFEIALLSLIEAPQSYNVRLADALNNPEEVENRLIEVYRVEFYEWLANELLETNNSSIEAMANNKANKIISENAKKGAIAKKAKYQPLKELAKKLVDAKKFNSRRNAAITITPEIIAESKKLNIPLSEMQAEITINSWLKEMGLPANV